MNDLTRYLTYKSQLQPGDLFLFDGSDDSDLVELVQHVLPNGIEVLTGSDFSHVSMFLDSDLPVDRLPQIRFNMIESTILVGKDGVKHNGPQINEVEWRLANYDGASVWLFQFKDSVRAGMDFPAMWDLLMGKVGKDHYSIRTIRDFLLSPVFGWAFPSLNKSKSGEEVCSEYIAQGLQASTLLNSSFNAHKCSPGTLIHLPLFKPPVQLIGKTLQATAA